MAHQLEVTRRLKTTMWRTSGARFWAARRLQWRSRCSSFSIAMFAFLALAISIYQIVDVSVGDKALSNFLTFSTLTLSLFVLVISLLEAASSYDVKALVLQQNAISICEIQKELEDLIAQVEDGKIKALLKVPQLRARYNTLIRECGENHSPLDDQRFRADHRFSEEFKTEDKKLVFNAFEAWWIRSKFKLVSAWLYALLWAVIAILFVGSIIYF